jgi:hypothetical protein
MVEGGNGVVEGEGKRGEVSGDIEMGEVREDRVRREMGRVKWRE